MILNHLIHWGQVNYPNAKIRALPLSVVDEGNPDNKKRRNKLYTKIGLIHYEGAKLLSDLTPVCNARDFEVIDLHEYVNLLLLNQSNLKLSLSETQEENESFVTNISNLKEENRLLQSKTISNIIVDTTCYLTERIKKIIEVVKKLNNRKK